MPITAARKGDGHPHLVFEKKTLCGRTLKQNRWAKVETFGEAHAAQLVALTLQRPHSMSAVCQTCLKQLDLAA